VLSPIGIQTAANNGIFPGFSVFSLVEVLLQMDIRAAREDGQDLVEYAPVVALLAY